MSATHDSKPKPQWLVSIMPASLAERATNALQRPYDRSQDYLIGVRGCLAIMSFLWVFLQTFAPTAVAHTPDDEGPTYQHALRDTLSIIFWNDSLIYSSIIFLSARTICLPFLLDPTKITLASSVVRRGFRLWLPTAAALIVVYAVFSRSLGTDYLSDFKNRTSNAAMHADIYIIPDSLTNFNAIFEIFWVSHNFSVQGGNWAFPTQTLWIISAVFQQSYTVYATMIIIPFTRKSWRLWGAFIFIITAWWVYSWAWFSVSGLLLADLVMNMDLAGHAARHRAWYLVTAGLCLFGGYFMMFYWVAARPDLQVAETLYHTNMYATGGINLTNDPNTPQLRADNYLVIVGFYILLETTDFLKAIFRSPAFVFIGRRSLSYFLIQSIIVYTLGIKTALLSITGDPTTYDRAAGVAFLLCFLVTVAAGEIFHWILEWPSEKLGVLVFDWLRE